MADLKKLLVAKDEHLYFFDAVTGVEVISGQQLLGPALNQRDWQQYDVIVFLDFGFEPLMAERLRPLTTAQLILFFWNHLTGEKIQLLEAARQSGVLDGIYSFDPLEAVAFHLEHNSTFYAQQQLLPEEEACHDLFFGASNNGRMGVARVVGKILERLDLDIHYFILEGRGNDQQGYLPYRDYLKFVAQSKGILEIMRPGQSGLTLRSMEAVYFRKKLVTTNKEIRYYHFYDPRNIFIVEEDDFAALPAFLAAPYQQLPQDYTAFYDCQQWFERFGEDSRSFLETYEYKPQLLTHR